jgi:RNA polymerase sigma factor (sigma-70 family)
MEGRPVEMNEVFNLAHHIENEIPPAFIDGATPEDHTHAHSGAENNAQSLMRNYRKFLMGRCCMLTHGNRHDANDLFSRVMLKVCSARPDQLRQIRHLGGWLSRIAYHQFIDDQRERQSSARRDDGLAYLYETLGVASPSAEQEYLNAELNRQLSRAFETLPTRLRRAAYLRLCEEAPYEEIAADLSISQANARKHIQEARRLLGVRVSGYVSDQGLAPWRPA